MVAEKIARLSTATITFFPVGATDGIVLGYQQSAN